MIRLKALWIKGNQARYNKLDYMVKIKVFSFLNDEL